MSRSFSMMVVLAIFVSIAGSGRAWAATAMYTATNYGLDESGDHTGDVTFAYSVGNQFTVTVPTIVVTALGVYDDAGDGLNTSHDVVIYGPSGLVASAIVAAGTTDPLIDGFRYVTLTTPVALVSGVSYQIVTNYPPPAAAGGDARYHANDAVFNSDISYTQGVFGSTPDGSIATGFSPAPVVYAGPNFLFVPEPASAGLLAVGAATMLGSRRREIMRRA